MIYTTGTIIDVHKVLPINGEPAPEIAKLLTSVKNNGETKTYSTIFTTLDPTVDTEGFIKITVPIELGSSSIEILESTEDDFETNGNITSRIERFVVTRVVNSTEVLK